MRQPDRSTDLFDGHQLILDFSRSVRRSPLFSWFSRRLFSLISLESLFSFPLGYLISCRKQGMGLLEILLYRQPVQNNQMLVKLMNIAGMISFRIHFWFSHLCLSGGRRSQGLLAFGIPLLIGLEKWQMMAIINTKRMLNLRQKLD